MSVALREEREIGAFLFEEARLLDAGQFDAWVDLFTDDGVYWVPSEPGQRSPEDRLSLFHEPKPLLRIRARRLAHPEMHVQVPAARTHHHVTGFLAHDAGSHVEVSSTLLLVTWRGARVAGEPDDRAQTMYSGRATHHLVRSQSGWRIKSKRVDLLNCDAPLRAISVPF